MSDTDLPVGIGPDLVKMIPGFVPMLFKLAVLNRGLSVYRVGTGYIQSYWVERGKHPHIRYNSSVISRMAVALRRHIHNQADVEARPFVNDRFGIFRHFLIQNVERLIISGLNCIPMTYANAPSTARAEAVVNISFFVGKRDSVMCAGFGAYTAAHALFLNYVRLACAVHFHFSRTRAAAHSDIFQGAPKPCDLMAFKMGLADKNICIHNGSADLGFLYVFSAGNRD